MADEWAERDLNAAMEGGAAQTDPAKRERAIGGVVSSWSDSDPTAAANFASSIENNGTRFERRFHREKATTKKSQRTTQPSNPQSPKNIDRFIDRASQSSLVSLS